MCDKLVKWWSMYTWDNEYMYIYLYTGELALASRFRSVSCFCVPIFHFTQPWQSVNLGEDSNWHVCNSMLGILVQFNYYRFSSQSHLTSCFSWYRYHFDADKGERKRLAHPVSFPSGDLRVNLALVFFFPGVRAHLTKGDVVCLLWYIYIKVVHGKKVHFSNFKQKCCGYILFVPGKPFPHIALHMNCTWLVHWVVYAICIYFRYSSEGTHIFKLINEQLCFLWSVNARCLRKAHVGCPKKKCVLCTNVWALYAYTDVKWQRTPWALVVSFLGNPQLISEDFCVIWFDLFWDGSSKTCKPVQWWFSVSLFCITV